MTYIAMPAARLEMPNFGIVALILLGFLSVVIGIRSPDAIIAEYRAAEFVQIGP